MAKRTNPPTRGKRYQYGIKAGGGWMLLPGIAGSSGSGGEPTTTPIPTLDETYLEPGDTPPPSLTFPVAVLVPELDVWKATQKALQEGTPVELVRETKKSVVILTPPATAKIEVPAAAEDPAVGTNWKKLIFSGADTPNFVTDSRIMAGMVVELTGGEELTIQEIRGTDAAPAVYVSGDAATAAAATFKVKIPRRQQGPYLCNVVASPIQTDDVAADSVHSGTLTLTPTGSVPNWEAIKDNAGLLTNE